jgi:hypothetical protein
VFKPFTFICLVVVTAEKGVGKVQRTLVAELFQAVRIYQDIPKALSVFAFKLNASPESLQLAKDDSK